MDGDEDVGSRLNRLDFTSVSETTWALLVDFHRMNHEGDAYFHGKAFSILHADVHTTEIVGVVVLDDTTTATWID